MKRKFLHLLVFGVSLLDGNAAVHAAPVLAGHSSLAGQALDGDAVRAVLLGKKIALGGTRVVIVVARAGEAQNAFLQSHAGMTTSQFLNYWRRLFMTGGGSAPRIVETEADAHKLAAEIPGAIVILDSGNVAGLTALAPN
ncbi:MAG: hypothetical protein ABJF10_03180 [Chthoniobacter sp.]|uniref:hypothetical protein n=1 Tax=Chthoniobacter sp. TaxID=2510640 RepID=UPI0032A16310